MGRLPCRRRWQRFLSGSCRLGASLASRLGRPSRSGGTGRGGESTRALQDSNNPGQWVTQAQMEFRSLTEWVRGQLND